MWWNGSFVPWMCIPQISINCKMLSYQYGPTFLKNAFSTLLNQCQDYGKYRSLIKSCLIFQWFVTFNFQILICSIWQSNPINLMFATCSKRQLTKIYNTIQCKFKIGTVKLYKNTVIWQIHK